MSHEPCCHSLCSQHPSYFPSRLLLAHPADLTRGMMKLCVSSRRCRLSRALCTSHGLFFWMPCSRKQGTESQRWLVSGILHTTPRTHVQALANSLYLEQPFKQRFVPVEMGSI